MTSRPLLLVFWCCSLIWRVPPALSRAYGQKRWTVYIYMYCAVARNCWYTVTHPRRRTECGHNLWGSKERDTTILLPESDEKIGRESKIRPAPSARFFSVRSYSQRRWIIETKSPLLIGIPVLPIDAKTYEHWNVHSVSAAIYIL